MADPMTAVANLLTAIPQLSQVPQCALPAYEAIAAAGCGPDLACICANDNFFLTLEGVILTGTCTPMDIADSLSSTRSMCIKAVPWLDDNRGPEIVAAITILTLLATIAVVMRILARRISNLKFGIDDWLIVVALAYVATTLIFPVSVTAIKLSVLFFYHRIFPMERFRKISIVIGLVVIAWFIAFIFLQFFTCIPLAYTWNKAIPGGHCINANHVAYYGTTPGDILTNFAILALPIPYLWSLQMQRAKKIAITVIFLLGSFAAVGSIVRIPFIVELKPTDVSYSVVNAGLWLNVECNIGILSACLPVLRPLFSKKFPSAIRSRMSRSRTARYGTGSQRLPDAEKAPRSSTIASSNISGAVYQGGNKSHKTWYNNAVSAMASKNDEVGSDCSQEEMVPMGKIAVRQEFDWDTRDREVGDPPNAV